MTKRALPVALFSATLILITVIQIRRAPEQFTHEHESVTADVAVAARNYARFGWTPLPVHNNPPFGAEDQYAHWPPLLPLMLGSLFRALGESETVIHLLALGIRLLSAVLIWRIGMKLMDDWAGALAGIFWLASPVVVHFGELAAQQWLGMMFLLGGILCFLDRRREGAILLFLGSLSAWEVVLAAVGFLFLARRDRLARNYVVAPVAGAALVMGWYLWHSPLLVSDAIQTARYYAGQSAEYSSLYHKADFEMPLSAIPSRIIQAHYRMLGPLALAAIFCLAISDRKRFSAAVPLALIAPWILWTILMPRHIAIHFFELALAAPGCALALAAFLKGIWFQNRGIAVCLAVAALFQPLLYPTSNSRGLIEFSRQLQARTPPGSVIISPLSLELPLWYSERHIIMYVTEDRLQRAIEKARSEYSRAPLYWAPAPDHGYVEIQSVMNGSKPAELKLNDTSGTAANRTAWRAFGG